MSRVPIPEPVPPHNEWQTWNPAEEKVKIISETISEQKHKSNCCPDIRNWISDLVESPEGSLATRPLGLK